MAQKRLDRRQMMKKSVGATTALIVGTQFPCFGIAAGDQQTFTGFNGQTIVWGGISYLPNEGPTALPNFFPLIDKTDPGSNVPILNNVLQRRLSPWIQQFGRPRTSGLALQKVGKAALHAMA